MNDDADSTPADWVADWTAAAPNILPVLSSTVFLGGGPAPLVRTTIAPHVHAYVALRPPGSERVNFVEPHDAGRWGKLFVEIVARAANNLPDIPLDVTPIPESDLLIVTAPDGLVTSRLLLPHFLPDLVHAQSSDIAFAMPEPSCIVVGDRSERSIQLLSAEAQRLYSASPEGLSPAVYFFDDEEPIFRQFEQKHATNLLLAREYELQRRALIEMQTMHDDNEIVIAPLQIVTHDNGGSATSTLLVRGAQCLLPDTELIFLAWQIAAEHQTDSTRFLLLERSELEQRCPGRIVRLGDEYSPPLSAALGFPTDTELQDLEAVAVASGTSSSAL